MPRLAPLPLCGLALCALMPGPVLPASSPSPPPTIVMPSATAVPPNPVSPSAGGAPAATTRAAAATGCLPGGNGYLRARIRGALNVDIDWRDAQIECEGAPRSDGSGIRVSFAGPRRSDGRRLRMVFGVNSVREGRSGRALPTNLTVIVEGGDRLYATRGEDRCTVDSLKQERLSGPGSKPRSYRIVARGFCVAPASTLNDAEHILVSSFDFAGTADFGAEDFENPQPRSHSTPPSPQAQLSEGTHVGR